MAVNMMNERKNDAREMRVRVRTRTIGGGRAAELLRKGDHSAPDSAFSGDWRREFNFPCHHRQDLELQLEPVGATHSAT